MKVHSQAAFLGDFCDQRECTKRQHQGQHPRRRRVQSKTGLFLSGAEDYSIAAAASAATAVTTAPATVSVPIANFDTSSNFEPVVFEPILNVPALVTFVLITTVFSALIVRTNQVEDAVQERKKRQEQVRELKAKEVSGGENIGSEVGGGTTSTTTTPSSSSSSSSLTLSEELQQTLKLYEEAVLREEKLRNILPGVRIVPPSSSDRKEEEVQAIAKQYLGRDFNIGVPKRYNEKQERSDNDKGSLPGAAIGVLAVVALSQVGLLAFFVFGADPMSSSTGGSALM